MPETNLHISKYSSKVLITVGIVIIFFIIISLLYNIPHLLLLLFISILIAVFLDGTANYLHKKTKISRPWGIFIVIVLIIGLIGISGYLMGPPVYKQMSKLAESIPQSINSIESSLRESKVGRFILSGMPDFSGKDNGKTFELFTGAFSSVLGGLVDALLVLVLGIYLGIKPSLYIDNLILLLPQKRRERAHEITWKLGHALRYWLLGRFIVMVSMTILTIGGLYAIGMPLPFALGLITGVLAFVPYLGAFAAFVPVILVALSESPTLAVYASIVYLVLHNIEGYVLTPIIQEHVVSIPPGFLIIMQIMMFILFGPLGVLIATPLGVVIVVLVQTTYIEDILEDRVKVLGEK